MRLCEGLVALRQQLGGGQRRLCPCQRSLGAFQAGLKWCRIDLIELLTGLHVTALGKQPLEDYATNLRAYLGDAIGNCAAGQVGGDGHRLWMQRHHADLRWCAGGGGFMGRTRRQSRDPDETEDGGPVEGKTQKAASVHGIPLDESSWDRLNPNRLRGF